MADSKRRDDYDAEIGSREDDIPMSSVPAMKTQPAPSRPSALESPVMSILAYCGSSILMTVTNKFVLSGTGFNLNFFLLLVQAVVCIVAIEMAKRIGKITYRDFNSDEAKKWFPVSLLLISMIYTGSKALQYLSIPVYTIFKNLTIIIIAYGEVLWFGGSVTPMALLSFGLMVLSSVVAAWADIQHALSSHGVGSGEAAQQISTLNSGYMWMFLNCMTQASFVLYMRKRIKLTNFSDFDTMFYNNLLSIPILLICTVVLEDWSAANVARNFPIANRTNLLFTMLISGLSAVFISYTSAWCVRVASSTTYSMVGALNKLPVSIAGLVFFDAPVTFAGVTAIMIGFVSGIVYAIARVRQSAAKAIGLPTTQPVGSASSASQRDGLRS